jgi:hypothetical protein
VPCRYSWLSSRSKSLFECGDDENSTTEDGSEISDILLAIIGCAISYNGGKVLGLFGLSRIERNGSGVFKGSTAIDYKGGAYYI